MKKKILVLLMCLCLPVVFCACGDASGSYESDDSYDDYDYDYEEESSDDPTEDMTMSQANAYDAALSYLEFSHFSKKGLIDQLSSEYGDGYDLKDAKFAVNAVEENGLVDWYEQAEGAARDYLDSMSFSKNELIDQLESEYGDNFTHDQAVKAVQAVYK